MIEIIMFDKSRALFSGFNAKPEIIKCEINDEQIRSISKKESVCLMALGFFLPMMFSQYPVTKASGGYSKRI